MTYTAVFVYDVDGITVIFPDLPGCITCGETRDVALDMAKDAMDGWLETCKYLGRGIPKSTKISIESEIEKAKENFGYVTRVELEEINA